MQKTTVRNVKEVCGNDDRVQVYNPTLQVHWALPSIFSSLFSFCFGQSHSSAEKAETNRLNTTCTAAVDSSCLSGGGKQNKKGTSCVRWGKLKVVMHLWRNSSI